MYKYIIKQLKRSIISNLLFCLLLALAGALLCITAGLWFSAHNALQNIDDTITTIAMPDPFFIRRFAENNSISEEEVLETIRNEIYTSGQLQKDTRRVFNAFADGITPVPLRVSGLGLDPNLAAYSPQSIAVFFVTCEKVDVDHDLLSRGWDDDNDTYLWYLKRRQTAAFTVEESLFLNRDYSDPRYISIDFHMAPDGTAPFERGKQYIVMGNFAPGSGFPRGFSSLTIDSPYVEIVDKTVGVVHSEDEMQTYINHMYMSGWFYIPESSFPIEIIESVYNHQPSKEDGEYSFFETDGSLEDILRSEQWMRMKETLDVVEISAESFQILTTNDANSLFRLNQRRNLFDDGRTFNAREIRTGAKVSLVSRQFAETNNLKVGDSIPLEIYAAVFGTAIISYNPSEDASEITQSIWIPSLFDHGLSISDPVEYTIIGIMDILPSDFSSYAISRNTVIIPDRSFGGIEGEPVSRLETPDFVPLLHDAIIVPNGHIEETRAVINSIIEGYGDLFRFYDQGYGSVSSALNNLRFGMSWILALATAVWVSITFLFSFFYTARKREEAGVLNALGVGRSKRFRWVFVQSALLILFSLVTSLAISLPLYSYILNAAADVTETITRSFRDLTLSDAADSGIRSRIPLDSSPVAMIITAITGAVLLLVVTACMTKRAVIFNSLDAGKGDD